MPVNFAPASVEYIRFLPEIILIAAGTLLMVLDVILRKHSRDIYGHISILALAAAMAAAVFAYSSPGPAFSDMLVVDGFATFFSVPAAIRMISGRNRMYSTLAGAKLTGMRDLGGPLPYGRGSVGDGRGSEGGGRGRLHAELYVHLRLFQNPRRGLAHGGQERLRIHAHPNHHHDQRQDGGPLARLQIEDMMPHFIRCLAVEHALVEPQHVTRRQNHTDGGEI